MIGDYTFSTDGALSNITLNLWDYSYEKGNAPSYAFPNSGSIGISEDKEIITLKVVSSRTEKVKVGETLTHETQLHGYKIANEIKGKKTTTEIQDHSALKNNDINHQGYKQYKSMQEQLQQIDENYKRAFKQAQIDANKQY